MIHALLLGKYILRFLSSTKVGQGHFLVALAEGISRDGNAVFSAGLFSERKLTNYGLQWPGVGILPFGGSPLEAALWSNCSEQQRGDILYIRDFVVGSSQRKE
jgi:hypothetical protein